MKIYYLSISTVSRSIVPISFWVAYHDTYTEKFLWKGWDNSKSDFEPTTLRSIPNSSSQSTFEIPEHLATIISSLTPAEVYLVVQQHFPEILI